MSFNPFSQHSILGLDIQSDGIHLVKLNKKRQIERMIMKPMPAQVFCNGKLTHWEKLRSCINELVAAERLNGMATAICLSCDQVKMQRIHLPVGLSDGDIQAEIFLHLQRDLFPTKDTVRIDYSILGQQEDYVEIFFVATNDSYLSQYTACVNASGLKVKIIDVDVFAAKRAIKIISQSLDVQEVLQALNERDYLIAYGLAMRAIPLW